MDSSFCLIYRHENDSFPFLHTVRVVSGDTVDASTVCELCVRKSSALSEIALLLLLCGLYEAEIKSVWWKQIVVRAHEQCLCYLMVHNRAFIPGYLVLLGCVRCATFRVELRLSQRTVPGETIQKPRLLISCASGFLYAEAALTVLWYPGATDGLSEKWRMLRWSTSVSYIPDSLTNFSFRLGTLLPQKYLTHLYLLCCIFCLICSHRKIYHLPFSPL